MASGIATPKVALFFLIICLFNTIGKAENPSFKSTDDIDPSLIEALLTPVRPKQQNVNSPANTLPPSKVPHSRPSKPLLRQQQPAEKRRPKVVKGKTLLKDLRCLDAKGSIFYFQISHQTQIKWIVNFRSLSMIYLTVRVPGERPLQDQ